VRAPAIKSRTVNGKDTASYNFFKDTEHGKWMRAAEKIIMQSEGKSEEDTLKELKSILPEQMTKLVEVNIAKTKRWDVAVIGPNNN
jgi:hypothetical protein